MAREIAALKMSRERLAILVKDRFQGARLERYLKGRHIEAEFSGASLEKRKEVLAALIEVMEGVVDYDDQATLKRALASTLIGFDEGKLQDQKTLSYAKGQALSLDHIWKQKGFGSWYQAFLQTSWEETGSSVIQLLEEETLLELESICEWVLELERVQHYVSHQLISALGELAKVEQEEDVFGPPLATDSKRVQIMTVHKSKGLEFDIVFALALASRHLSCEELVAIKDRGEEQIIPYDETNPLVQKATQERDAEKMRQLYVALTRAKKRIYLPILFEEEGKEPPAGAASPNELFFSKLTTKDPLVCLEELSKACSITYTKVEKEEKLILAQENQEPLVIRPPPLVELGSFSEPILSFSSVSKSEKSTTVVPRMATEEKSAHTLPPGALTGVIIHAIFEKIFSFGLFSPLQPDRIDALIQEEVQDTLLQNWEKTIFQMVDKALHLPLGLEPSFCLADLKSNAVLPEIEFLYPWEDGYLKGFIDLAFQKDGKVYLLDWKTNWLGDSKEAYTKQNLQKAMQEHDYFLQASIYTQALQRTLQGTHVRPFNEIFGGALYFFLRGPQVFLGSVKQ
jgi:exodeoxyribonuclease V beta subunit